MKLNYSIILVALTALLFSGCQRDDICPETTETTSLLVIEFFDAESAQTLKAVTDLEVYAEGEEEPLLGPVNTNSIALPLRTDRSFTEFRFVANSGSEEEAEEFVRFSYNPNPDYLNRACGFKINFLDLSVSREAGETPWIISHSVNIDDIENETETHIFFTH